MTMAVPFALSLIAAALAMVGRRDAALWGWLVLAAVTAIWFASHLTSHIDIAL